MASRRCPGLRIVPARVEAYRRAGAAVFACVAEAGEEFRRLSIDEGSWLVPGALDEVEPSREVLESMAGLRAQVRAEFGLPLSVGVASSRVLAKLACSAAKPDGLAVIAASVQESFLQDMLLADLPGVGPISAAKLSRTGLTRVRDLLAADPRQVQQAVGPAAARHVSSVARGLDPPVSTAARHASTGTERSFPTPLSGSAADEQFEQVLVSALHRALEQAHALRTVTVSAVTLAGVAASRSVTLDFPTRDVPALADAARAARSRLPPGAVTSLGVTLTTTSAPPQPTLPLRVPGELDQLPARPELTLGDVAYAGMAVVHKALGPGVVAGLQNDTVAVRFPDRVRFLDLAGAPLSWDR
jgi:DNA polymerase-4